MLSVPTRNGRALTHATVQPNNAHLGHRAAEVELHKGRANSLTESTTNVGFGSKDTGNGPRLQLMWRSGCPPVMME